ncbi:circadian clock protein KaiB [Chitinophaga sp. SYP-B3965]|uniref:circadian clock KaiB family protein n=1 Tax=Chitinophaga sp. SYP-B3965 TaxID=2663120 RepID=UPI0012996FD9|nr:circadian clock KaiB family protein [Chitinophaga sp. SYP-B3965]MRG44634.1 circadian clock protein KaiB [Chitinophaga sp. SYP-B3965]
MQKKEEQQLNSRPSAPKVEFVLRLFVTGASPNSVRAIANLKELCEEYLPGQYSLEVIDVYQEASVAQQEQIVALPLLIKKSPFPERRMIGDLSDTDKVLKGLGLKAH